MLVSKNEQSSLRDLHGYFLYQILQTIYDRKIHSYNAGTLAYAYLLSLMSMSLRCIAGNSDTFYASDQHEKGRSWRDNINRLPIDCCHRMLRVANPLLSWHQGIGYRERRRNQHPNWLLALVVLKSKIVWILVDNCMYSFGMGW